MLVIHYLPPNETFPKSKAAAMKAMEIDDTLSEAHAYVGAVHFFYDWDWPRAGYHIKRATELSPSSAAAHILNTYYLELMGRQDEAMAEIMRAHDLDPLAPVIELDIGVRYYNARQYDLAIEQFRRLSGSDFSPAFTHNALWMAYEQKGEYEKAIAELQHLIGSPDASEEGANLKEAFAQRGYRAALREQLDTMRELFVRPFGDQVVL